MLYPCMLCVALLRGPMAPKHDIFQNVFEMIF